jgi:hypothetical protein
MVGSLINDPFKDFGPTDLLFPQLTFPNPIFGPKIPKKLGFPRRKSPLMNVV